MRSPRFAPAGLANARPADLGSLGFGLPVPRSTSTETTGSPKFLGNPPCTFAGLFDPGRTPASDQLRRRGTAPVAETSRAPTLRLSRLNPPASVLAVYASPRQLSAWDARLASGCWSGSAGRASTRRVPTRGFRVLPYISSSSPKLAWRNSAFRAAVGREPQGSRSLGFDGLGCLISACVRLHAQGRPFDRLRASVSAGSLPSESPSRRRAPMRTD